MIPDHTEVPVMAPIVKGVSTIDCFILQFITAVGKSV